MKKLKCTIEEWINYPNIFIFLKHFIRGISHVTRLVFGTKQPLMPTDQHTISTFYRRCKSICFAFEKPDNADVQRCIILATLIEQVK